MKYKIIILLMVLLSPIVTSQESFNIKEPTITNTPTTDTTCNNGVCNLILYSGVRNVYENNEWKKIENATSLNNSGIKCVVDSDNIHLAECLDFNYTHRKVKLSLDEKAIIDKTDIPITVIRTEWNDILEKEVEIEISSTKKDFTVEKTQDEWIKADFGDVIKVGEDSTTIILQDNESENLGDTYVYKNSANSNYGTIDDIWLLPHSSYVKRGYFKFNISSIPPNQVIDNATLYLFSAGTSGVGSFNISTYNIYYDWNETNITWNNQPCGIAFDNSVNCSLTTDSLDEISTDSGVLFSFNSTTVTETAYSRDDEFVGIVLRPNPESGGIIQVNFASKEHINTVSRPYLNITYSEPPPPELIKFRNQLHFPDGVSKVRHWIMTETLSSKIRKWVMNQ